MKALLLALTTFLAGSCAHASSTPPSRNAVPLPARTSLPQPPASEWGLPELYTAINARRLGHGLPPLRVDRGLCAVAERASSDYQRLGRGSERIILGLIKQNLEGFGLSFARVSEAVATDADVHSTSKFLDAAPEFMGAALDPSMVYVGLSVSPAPPPVGPQGGYSVVLTLGG